MSAATVRAQGLDKFYTKPSVAKKCLDTIGEWKPWSSWGLVVEPSAGNGSFFHQIPTDKKVGLDLLPGAPTILQQDFFTYTAPPGPGPILVVGNPPFGRVSSLAVRFFWKAASFSSALAFILPRTFRRSSIQNRLPLSFHLIHDEDIPMEPCSFDPPMMAKCCFQIWEKREEERVPVALPTTHPHWTFLSMGPKDAEGQPTPPQGADFALRAYGGRVGEMKHEGLQTLRPKSWHWIRSQIPKEILVERFEALAYEESLDTARQNSLGKGDLVRLYTEAYGLEDA